MSYPIKNVLLAIQSKLKADAATIALLSKGSDSVFIWKRLTVNDFNGMPKPFINIYCVDEKERIETSSKTRDKWVFPVTIDYVKKDFATSNIMDDYADLDTIETVLLSKALTSISHPSDNERSYQEINYSMKPIFDNGYITYKIIIDYAYYQNR